MASRETVPLYFCDFYRHLFLGSSSSLSPECLSGKHDGLALSGAGVLMCLLAQHQPAVAICDSLGAAEKLYRASFSLSGKNVFFLPEQRKSSSDVPGFTSEVDRYRHEAINTLPNLNGLLVTTKTAIETEDILVDNQRRSFHPVVGKDLNRVALIGALDEWGYERVDKTQTPNTYSIRGGILDVFLHYSKYPVRIEFFGSLVESLRLYNPVSQRRIGEIHQIEIMPPSFLSNNKKGSFSFLSLLDNNVSKYTIEKDGPLWKVSPLKQKATPGSVCTLTGRSSHQLLEELKKETPAHNNSVFVFIDNKTQLQRIKSKLPFSVEFVSGGLREGFVFGNNVCLSGNELLGAPLIIESRWESESLAQQPLSSLLSLSWGDLLVHRDYGIGRYRGLSVIQSKAREQECVKIEYADGAAVHVPLEKFNRVHRYVGKDKGGELISSLGSPKWNREKRRVVASASGVIKSLVLQYTEKSKPRGFVYNKNDDIYSAVVDGFPYKETKDQQNSISAVNSDMEKDRPMDRLVCGDVGFGKTEVALRAAVKAVISGKKVLFLSPTTILADQHYITFKDRLTHVGIHVELLSRFRTKSEQRRILEKMMSGYLDIVIGTHRLLSNDVRFPNLGLLIVDEEHRFGVKHKERLRNLRTSVDVLTLTATPIPRTLQQSLIGIRDLSVINTPPKARKPIHTAVQYFNWASIEKVVSSELLRGGQVYFLHNDVLSLPFYSKELSNRFPDASVAIAHGQMSSKELERVVLAFFSGKINILLCTTIIESGLDVSNANTIIINHAQNFGLSQLYQIRGRVGRSPRQAYCYLCLPKNKQLSADAHRRLKAIEHHTSLGSGYNISVRDLEIRGAGNLFGLKQSGHMAKVGFDLYCKLLEEAVEEQTGHHKAALRVPTIVFLTKTLLEPDFVPLVQDRLYFYQRLSDCHDIHSLNDTHDELLDRFGPLPSAADRLFSSVRLRICLAGSSVSSVSVDKKEVVVSLTDSLPFESFSHMVFAVRDALGPLGCPYRLTNEKQNKIQIHISTISISLSLEVSHEFVKLFSVLDCE